MTGKSREFLSFYTELCITDLRTAGVVVRIFTTPPDRRIRRVPGRQELKLFAEALSAGMISGLDIRILLWLPDGAKHSAPNSQPAVFFLVFATQPAS